MNSIYIVLVTDYIEGSVHVAGVLSSLEKAESYKKILISAHDQNLMDLGLEHLIRIEEAQVDAPMGILELMNYLSPGSESSPTEATNALDEKVKNL